MHSTRRLFASLALALPLWVAGCASTAPPAADPAVRAALAPTGTLRVGVYPGSPSSLVRDARTGQPAGVAYELGQALGRELGVPVRVVEYQRVAQVIDGLKAGEVDMTFTNASEARAREVDFTPPLVRLELGYLLPPGSTIATPADVDQPGRKVGVTQGSTSQATLPRLLKAATLVPLPSMAQVQQQLAARQIDAFATNKGILHEVSDQVPGSRVLEGHWGIEQLAIAVPQGRRAGAPFLQRFAQQVQASGRLQGMVERAGMRGLARD